MDCSSDQENQATSIRSDRSSEAKKFKRWLTHEVIPAIRKTDGVYMTPERIEEVLSDPETIIKMAHQTKQLQDQRDEAVRTKAHISIVGVSIPNRIYGSPAYIELFWQGYFPELFT